MGRLLVGILVVAVALTGEAAASSGMQRATGYPNSLVVLGDSAANGFASNTAHPFQDAPQNSWATGTNPAVNSIYQRILALNPAIKGNATNLAQDDAGLAQFAAQVHRAIALKPDLVLLQIGGSDIKCDGQDATRYAAFKTQYAAGLQQLTAGLPQAKIFVIGEWGSLPSYAKAMLSLSVADRLTHAGKGPCSLFAPQSSSSPGSLVPAALTYIEKTFKGYDAQRKAACAEYPSCTYDGGAAESLVVTPSDLATRYEHLSIAGQAKLAAIEWTAMKRLHVIPG